MVLAARRLGWNRDVAVLGGLAVLVTASLGYSVWETVHNPAAAYFVTPDADVGARRRRHCWPSWSPSGSGAT